MLIDQQHIWFHKNRAFLAQDIRSYIDFAKIDGRVYQFWVMVAEEGGFEPPRGFHPNTLSRRAP